VRRRGTDKGAGSRFVGMWRLRNWTPFYSLSSSGLIKKIKNIVNDEASSHLVVKVAFVESMSVSKEITVFAAYPGERSLSLFV
jgi:hypothetical protein